MIQDDGTTAQAGAAPGGAHLRDYWRIVWRGRWTVLAILVLCVAVAVLRVSMATPIYKATAVLEVKPDARSVMPGQQQWVGNEGRSWISDELYFNTQLEILRSRDLATRTFDKLDLGTHHRFVELEDDNLAIAAFSGSIEVKPKVNTRLVQLSITGPDPAECAEWANTLAHLYVDRNVEVAKENFNRIKDEIERSARNLTESLENADRAAASFTKGDDVFSPEDRQEILRKNLDTYSTELSTVRVKIGALKAELDSIDRVRREGGDLTSLPSIATNEAVINLIDSRRSYERELQRLAKEKTTMHPEYLKKEGDLRKIEADIDDLAGGIVEELRQNYTLAVRQASNLEREIQRTETEGRELQESTSEYEIAQASVESKRRVYDVVTETVEQFSLNAQLIAENNNVRVVDDAVAPLYPIKPRKKLTVAFGGFVGLLLGIGAVLFLDYLDNTIRTPEDIEQYLGLNVLAIIPKYRNKDENPVREAFQSLRTSILFSSVSLERRTILMTSAGAQEGKSSTVHNLARALASAGDRVIVVDCDLRRPTVHKHMQMTRDPGLTNFLTTGRGGDYREFVRDTPHPNLYTLTCGPLPPNPTELLGTNRFQSLVETLGRDYDWVVMDTPPVANIADTVVLAPLADLVLLVIKHNENDRDLIRRSVKRLRDHHVEVAGTVLNSMSVGSGYDSYYASYEYEARDETKPRRSRLRPSGSNSADPDKDRAAL